MSSLLTAALLGALGLAGCGDRNPGVDPPAKAVAFPSGVLLDPRVSTTGPSCAVDACGPGLLCSAGKICREPARWLFVTNANSDRRFNGGSLLAINLEEFWNHAEGIEGEIQDADTELVFDAEQPQNNTDFCRRVANVPQTVECLEEPFVAPSTVFFGNFPGPAAAWTRGDETRLLVPVRGDPSITYVDVQGGLGPNDAGSLSLDCFDDDDPDSDPPRCDDAHRLRFFRNEETATRLSREPFRVLVSDHSDSSEATLPPLAYVSHQGDQDVTLIALEGLVGESSDPGIVHQANLLSFGDASPDFQGGFGLAERPCDPTFAPNSTIGCTRPLVYGAIRHAPQLQLLTSVLHQDPTVGDPDPVCVDGQDVPLGSPGAFVCDPQAEPLRRIDAGGLPQTLSQHPSRPYLGDIGFSRSGDELYVVQSNPGALLRVDTSIGVDGTTVDLPAGLVEVCAQPTSLTIYSGEGDGAEDLGNDVEYGVVTCYRSGEVFIIDLANLTVVGLSRAGIGPDAVAVDLAREVIYVANTLDATISVISMSESDPARFTEIARIGLQEPYV